MVYESGVYAVSRHEESLIHVPTVESLLYQNIYVISRGLFNSVLHRNLNDQNRFLRKIEAVKRVCQAGTSCLSKSSQTVLEALIIMEGIAKRIHPPPPPPPPPPGARNPPTTTLEPKPQNHTLKPRTLRLKQLELQGPWTQTQVKRPST